MYYPLFINIVNKLKQLRASRFKPKFDDNENIRLDQQIDALVSSLTDVNLIL